MLELAKEYESNMSYEAKIAALMGEVAENKAFLEDLQKLEERYLSLVQ